MKKKLIGAILVSLICWAYPVNTLAQTAEQSKPNTQTKTKPSEDYVSEDIIIKNNAIRPHSNRPHELATAKPSYKSPRPTEGSYTGRDNPAYQSRPEEYTGRQYSKDEVKQLIRDYSAIYGISPNLPLCLVENESGYNWASVNRTSTARGAAQYLIGTWLATDEGKIGRSRFDADASIKAMVKYLAIHKSPTPWVVWPKCPSLTFIK